MLRTALLTLIALPSVAQAAPLWPKVLDGWECTDAPVPCTLQQYVVLPDGTMGRASDGAVGWWARTGLELSASVARDEDGDGMDDFRITYRGLLNTTTGCATGTWIDWNGRTGTWSACK